MSEQHIELHHRHRRSVHPQRRERRLLPLEELALTVWALAAAAEQTGDEALTAELARQLDLALDRFCRPDGSFSAEPGDSQVLPGPNALMIAALARGGRVLGQRRYLQGAEEARLFLKTRLTDPQGWLFARWEDRVPSGRADRAEHALCALCLMELGCCADSRFALRQGVKLARELAEQE